MNEQIQQKIAYLPSQCGKENCELLEVNNIMFALKNIQSIEYKSVYMCNIYKFCTQMKDKRRKSK